MAKTSSRMRCSWASSSGRSKSGRARAYTRDERCDDGVMSLSALQAVQAVQRQPTSAWRAMEEHTFGRAKLVKFREVE